MAINTRTVLVMTVFAIMALTFSVFTTPLVYAEPGPLIKAQKYKLSPSKVCGVSLCDNHEDVSSISIDIQQLGYNDLNKQAAFDKALESRVALSILKEYHAYKQSGSAVTDTVETTANIRNDSLFANPDYGGIKTIVPSKQIEVESIPYVVVIPEWIKSSYANPDFPVVQKPIVVEPMVVDPIINGMSVELIDEISITVTNSTE